MQEITVKNDAVIRKAKHMEGETQGNSQEFSRRTTLRSYS